MSFLLYLLGVLVTVFTAQALLVTPRLIVQWEVEGRQLSSLEVLYVNTSSAVGAVWWLGLLLGVGLIVSGSILRRRTQSRDASRS